MPCRKKIATKQIAYLVFQNAWVHFGLPTLILLDRKPCFLGVFWTNLWKMMDTKLKRRMAFHPQTDIQIDVFNAPWYTCWEAVVVKILCFGMSIIHICNIPTIQQCTHLCIVHHLRHVLATCQKILLIWSLEVKMTLVDVMTRTKHNGSFSRSR